MAAVRFVSQPRYRFGHIYEERVHSPSCRKCQLEAEAKGIKVGRRDRLVALDAQLCGMDPRGSVRAGMDPRGEFVRRVPFVADCFESRIALGRRAAFCLLVATLG